MSILELLAGDTRMILEMPFWLSILFNMIWFIGLFGVSEWLFKGIRILFTKIKKS